MQNRTRELYEQYTAQVAQLNGVGDATVKFNVDPSVQQTLEDQMTESSSFLQQINTALVEEQVGEKIGLGIGNTVASTTDTETKDRETQDPTTLDPNGYFCKQINFDSHLTYKKLDMWAKFPDFQIRVRNFILLRQLLDRIMMGFNGTNRAATSDRVANPMLEDVAVGWLQKIRDDKPENVLSEDGTNAGKIIIGSGQPYETLDAVVRDLVNSAIDPWFQEDTGLVTIIGRELLQDKYFDIENKKEANSETLAGQVIVAQKRVGTLPAVRVPYFPPKGLLVTRMDNLSVYVQEGKRRRTIVDNAKRDRIENYESSNDDFVVEDYGLSAMAENIEFDDAA